MRALVVPLFVTMLVGCAQSEVTLIVQVRSDLRSGVEVSSAETVASTEGGSVFRSTPLVTGQDFANGVRVADFTELQPGSVRVSVALFDEAGAVVVERPVLVQLEVTTVVTVLLVRDCVGVSCGPGEACLAGACVSESCTEESPEACGPPECVTADDCTPPVAACAAVACTASGTCFVETNHVDCSTLFVCDPDVGCVLPS